MTDRHTRAFATRERPVVRWGLARTGLAREGHGTVRLLSPRRGNRKLAATPSSTGAPSQMCLAQWVAIAQECGAVCKRASAIANGQVLLSERARIRARPSGADWHHR